MRGTSESCPGGGTAIPLPHGSQKSYSSRPITVCDTIAALCWRFRRLRRWPWSRRGAGAGAMERTRSGRRRAIMHRAATVVFSSGRGFLPRPVESLRKLPGIGRYTASAIASIAYGGGAPPRRLSSSLQSRRVSARSRLCTCFPFGNRIRSYPAATAIFFFRKRCCTQWHTESGVHFAITPPAPSE